RHRALQRRLVLVEEFLRRADQLLADRLVLVVREHGHWPEQPDRAPRDGQRGADDLRVVLFRHEAAPGLHQPAVVNVLRATECLARPGAELAFEEIAEGLLEDVLHARQVALAHAPNLNFRKSTLRIQARPIDGGPHEAPARSSSRVMIPERSRPPRPLTRMALKSSCPTAPARSRT